MGRPYQGVQAEYLRVPYGDFNCLRLGEDAVEKELDYVMVADIFPTGWHATEKAGCTRGTLSSFTVQDPSGSWPPTRPLSKGPAKSWSWTAKRTA
jgi:glutathione-independent formaldehyde dehydrogenase